MPQSVEQVMKNIYEITDRFKLELETGGLAQFSGNCVMGFDIPIEVTDLNYYRYVCGRREYLDSGSKIFNTVLPSYVAWVSLGEVENFVAGGRDISCLPDQTVTGICMDLCNGGKDCILKKRKV